MRCCRPCWIRRLGESCAPLPVLPLNPLFDFGEGECDVFMNTLISKKVNALRELLSASGDELSALMPSILDKAFKGEL